MRFLYGCRRMRRDVEIIRNCKRYSDRHDNRLKNSRTISDENTVASGSNTLLNAISSDSLA
jgi:hypothetical protein